MNRQTLKWVKGILLALFVLCAGVCYSCSRGEGESFPAMEAAGDELLSLTETEALSKDSAQRPDEDKPAESMEEPAVCYVHVCGAVLYPGVYRLREGQRIYEAIDLAGGFTENASRTWLNLAEKVEDGMKLEVPDIASAQQLQQASAAADASMADSRININTATREELMTLRGIGAAKAEDIISFREKQGYFQTIEDIMKVPGIKDSAFEKIKDEITV